MFLNKVKILSEAIPSTLKQFVLVGMYVLGTSMVKGIRRNEFNSCLKKCNTRFRPFIGATIKQMETYVKPIIQGDTPDVVILHIGCNDISNKKGIINIGRYCKEHNVNNVTISSLICRSQKHFQHKMNAVNNVNE